MSSNDEASEARLAVDVDVPSSGLYVGFEAYRTPTTDDYRSLLVEGIVVPDTNVFLNLYRYNEQTRSDLFAVMRRLGDTLWVPHWVVTEFWRSRENVLRDPRSIKDTVKELDSCRDRAAERIRSWVSRVGLSGERAEALTKMLDQGFDSVIEGITQLSDDNAAEFARDTNKDLVLAELEPILRDRIGPPLSEAEFKEGLAEAKRRAEEKRPPGYKDISKSAEGAAGDYLVWRQVLLQARSQRRDVLMVTGDIKEDWWRKEHGEMRGPRPELVEEMKSFAGVQLFMLRPESLLILARRILQIRVHDESVQDVERVDRALEETTARMSAAEEAAVAGLLAAVPDPVNTEMVQSLWPHILDKVKGQSRVAWMLLTNAIVEEVKGDILVIQFRREGEAKGFMSAGYPKDLRKVMLDAFGFDLRIEATYEPLPSKL